MSRTKKSIQNIIFSFGLQMVTIITNFVIRTFMIRNLGIQAVSVNGLFTEVLAALSLAEMGIGTAIVYNLYKPLADEDYDKVCQLMGLFKRAYQIIALVTFGLGFLLCPWIHLLVNSVDYSIGYIRIIYMLFLTDLSMSYLFTYKISLINADQKSYIQARASAVIKLVEAVIKISILLVAKNYILYLCCSILLTFLGNVVRSYVIERQYPWLKKNKKILPKEERKEVFENIKNLFVKTLSGKITNSTDNILISVLVNTIQVGIYSNYSLILGVFRQIANQIAYSGVGASLGNLLVTESKERCQQVFFRLVYLFYVLAALASVCIFNCVSAAMMLWWGSEEYLLADTVVFVCCMNLFIEIINRPLWSIMDVSGLFVQDKNIAIIGSLVNLVVSIALGIKIGIAGVFVGTFLTYLIQAILKARLLFRVKLQTTPVKFYLVMVGMFALTLLQMAVTSDICGRIYLESNLLTFVVNGLISAAITGGTIVLATVKTDSFGYYLGIALRIIRRR